MAGIDQISAKVSGTTLRVSPGQFNKGIYINLTGGPGEGERYHITHPVAAVNGILRGSFYVTISDSTIITCEGGKPGHKFRTIIEYKEEVGTIYSLVGETHLTGGSHGSAARISYSRVSFTLCLNRTPTTVPSGQR